MYYYFQQNRLLLLTAQSTVLALRLESGFIAGVWFRVGASRVYGRGRVSTVSGSCAVSTCKCVQESPNGLVCGGRNEGRSLPEFSVWVCKLLCQTFLQMGWGKGQSRSPVLDLLDLPR